MIALQDLLFRKGVEPVQKENATIKSQTTTRIRGGTTATTTPAAPTKQTATLLAPRARYILATEVANTTLKTLADALKNPPLHQPSKAKTSPLEDARKPTAPRQGNTKNSSASQRPLKERSVSQASNATKRPAPRRSSSYSSIPTSGTEPGLIATAECTRIAFAYLGTVEATRLLGKDTQDLQYENGVVALIGKLVALGLDGLAIKELRTLKRRLDTYLGSDDATKQDSKREEQAMTVQKDGLAALLSFATIELDSPAVPLVASYQIYVLRLIAKLKKPRTVEAAWEYLQLTAASSPVNLLCSMAKDSNSRTKAARQLESLAQIVFALCPSISTKDDSNQTRPSAEIVLKLQQLGFVIKKEWWDMVQHRGNDDSELLDPFAKCVVAFARRSHLTPAENYRLAEFLYLDLIGKRLAPGSLKTTTTLTKTLSSLAQIAGLPKEALKWLEPPGATTSTIDASGAKQTIRLIRIATISLEADLKGDNTPKTQQAVASALQALNGSLGGSQADLESLLVEMNALRRVATRLLVAQLTAPEPELAHLSLERQAISIVAASIHFSARFVGSPLLADADVKTQSRHKERIDMAWKCWKSNIDSVLSCCRRIITSQEQWQQLDAVIQESVQLMHRFEQEIASGSMPALETKALISSMIVKLSNAYWAVHLQLRKASLGPDNYVTAMQRSIDLILSRTLEEAQDGHLSMKLERYGEALEDLGRGAGSRRAFQDCIRVLLSPETLQLISERAAGSSMEGTFSSKGPLSVLARALKAYHRSFLKFSIQSTEDLAFYDDLELQAGTRGALLEWQLGFYLRTLSRNRQWDSKLDQSVLTIVERLRTLYIQEVFPVRHLRLSLSLLQLTQYFDQVQLCHDSAINAASSTKSEDNGLLRYAPHLQALHDLRNSMQQQFLPTSTIKCSCAVWESLLATSATWDAFTEDMDNVEDWLKDLTASVECLNARGEEYLALPVLHILIQALVLKNGPDASELVIAQTTMSLQFLRLGYTGKAGLCSAKAERTIENQCVSTEARLRWHLAYAEYLLAIGNSPKW